MIARLALCLLCAAVALAGTSCYEPPPITKPDVTASFPSTAEPGSTVTVTLTVSNPGPEMESVVVAFSRIGDPELPDPIVDVGTGGRAEAVAGVTPDPVAVSPDGVIYRFEGLAEGDSMEIAFELVLPKASGDVGNAVLVSDGSVPQRAKGIRLSIAL
ncbi:MAG TPA: hypothetical protein VE174_02770 [Actinomycetota bacterium]|nr:hypothetical protein [Actinomycetota bacterium]